MHQNDASLSSTAGTFMYTWPKCIPVCTFVWLTHREDAEAAVGDAVYVGLYALVGLILQIEIA